LVISAAACAPYAPPSRPAPDGPTAQVVNATILTNGCQNLGQANAQLAERAMYDLVEGCKAVPGGTARFEATLEPNGRIAISGAPGQPDVVPICVVKHALVHKVSLTKPCQLEVRMEQTTVPMPEGGAPR
jgi:hypothetical protein